MEAFNYNPNFSPHFPMKTLIRAIFGILAASLLAIIVAPMFAAAQVPTSQLVVVTQTSALSPVTNSSILVNVNATGPSLTGVPTSVGTLTYASTFNNDTRVITMVPGSYSVSIPSTNGYAYTYGSNCTGSMVAGETRTCTITATAGGTSYVNVTVDVQNRYGGSRSASDFVITVSGQNPSTASIQGSVGSTQISMGPGAYSINVGTSNGYSVTRTDGCSGTINSGETRSCYITVSDANNYYNGNNTYPVNQLSCTPANQTVYRGATVSFTAQGGVGTYSWATADRTYINSGPSLNVRLLSSGDQAVYVTSGTQTATCVVRVLPSTVTNTPLGVVYTNPQGGIVLGTNTEAPGLPNTGYGPSTLSLLLAFFAAFVALPLAVYALYPHAKRTASAFLG